MFWHLRARVIPILTLIMDILLFSLLAQTVNSLASVLISSPFDNFRIECPQSSGAQRLAIRMVESQGQKRQDTVFVLNCQHIVELYPWLAMPDDIAEREREDCHYTQQFDPLLDRDIPWTCRPREYLAGIARLSDTRIQLECCRLRSRDEAGCVELEYEKPIGSGARVEIEYQAKLINAISIDGDVIRVRFCDLSPRQIEDIVADAGTTPRPTVPPPPPPARPLTTVVTPFRSSSGGQAAGAEPMLLNDPRKIVKQSQHKFSANPPPNINTDWQNGPPAELAQVDEEMQPGDGQQRVVAHGVNLQQEVQEPNGQSQVGAVQPADQPKAEEETQTTQSIEQQQTAQFTSKQELGQQPMPVEAEQDKEQVQPEATHQQIEQQQQMETQTVQPERQSEPQPQIETSTSAISVEMPTEAGETTATDPNQQQIMREAQTTAEQPAVHTIQFGNEEKEKMPMNDIGRDADLIKNESTADREGPRIKIHGLNFRTIQFGQNVQKVRAPEQEQEFAKQQESINGQIDGKERGKEEKPAADQREGNGRERMEEENNTSPPGDGRLNVEEQQEKAMENGQKDQQTSEPDQQQQTQTEPETSTTTTATTTTSSAAAEPKPTTISSSSAAKIKSNLLLRRRGMHDFTITLMPPRVGEPVGPGIGADRQRQAAELAIQKQVDAIRAVEMQIQIVKAEAGEKASEGAEKAKEERKQESVGKGNGRETKEGAEQQQESERRLDREKEMTEKKTANSIGQAVSDRKNETINEKEEKGFWVPSPNPPDPGFWVPQPMPDKHQTMEGKQEVVEPASREEAQKTTKTNGSDKEEKTEKQDQREDSDQRRKSNETKSDDNSSDQQHRSDLTDQNPNVGSSDQVEKTTTLVPNDGEAMHRILFGEPTETETSTKRTTNQDQEEQTTSQPQIKPISEEKPSVPKKKKPIQIRKLGQSETGEVHTIQLPGTPLRTIIPEQQKQEQKDLDEQPQQKHQQMEVSSRTSEAKASKTGKQKEVQFEAPNSSADQLDQWGVGNDQRKIKDAELPESLYSSTEPSEQQQQQSDGPEAQKKQEKPSDSASGKINDQLDPEVGLKSSGAPFSVINDSEGGQNSMWAKEQQGGEEKPSVDQKTTTNSTKNAEQNAGRQMDDKGSKKRLRIFSINLERTQTTNPTPIASSTASSSPTTVSNDKEEESEGEKPNDQQEGDGKGRETEEMKKQQQSQRQRQQQEEVGGGFVAENEAQIKAIRKGLPIYSIDYLKQKQQQPVLGTLSSHAPRSSSEEVKAADQSVETMFPFQMEKELENVREASAELLHSLAGMMEHRQKARKIMDKVRQSTGIGRGEQPAPPSSREFADTMFREIEAQERSAKEMLSQLSTAITTRGPSVTEAEEATTIGIGTSHSSANISQTPVEATFTSPQPLANLSFSEDSQVEDISVERQPKAEAEAGDGGKLERRTIGGGMEKEMLTNENSSNSTVAMEEKSEWLGNSTLATKMEAETDMKKPEDDEDEEYEDEEEEKEADLDGGGRTECDNNNSTENAGDRARECAEGKQPTKTTTASSSAAAAKEQAMTTADQKGKEEKEADEQKEEREGEDEKTRLAQNNLAAKAKAAKTVEGPLAAEGKELRRTEAKHSGGAKARKAKAKKKQEEEEATKAEDVEELPTTEAPLAAADLPPLDAFPTPPPSSPSSGRGRLPPAPPPSQLPQLPAREEEQKRKKPNGQQQFGALTLTGQQSRAVMREGIDFEVAEEREHGISTAAGEGKGKAEKEGKEEKDEKEGKEREEEETTSSQSTTVTTKSRRPAATTTRVPLYKRRQLDRIALQVFGPAAFDPTEPRVPVDQQQEQPRRVIPARRPRPRHPQPPATSPAPSGPGATGLPDEETDTSPFDAERAQLLQRLRQRHRPGTNAGGGDWAPTSAARGSEENDENADGGAFDPSSAELRAKQQQPIHPEPTAAVDRPRLRGRFDRVHLGGRFEKEPSSPFDRSEGREKAGEIRRKPSIAAANFADSDIEKQPLALVEEAAQKMHRDGTPIFSPKDNQPMKMPKTEPRQRIVGKKEESIQQQEGKSNNEVKEVEAEKGVDQDILVPMSGGGENIKMDEHLRQQIEEDATTVTSAKTLETETTTATTEPATPSLEDKMPDKIQQPQKPRHSPKSTTKAPAGEQYWAFWTSGSNGPTVEVAATTSASPFYNAHKYFRMPSRRRGHQSRERENVLTFCSKSAALRDSSNLPIACAGEDGQVWSPPRCPPGTGCLAAADSAFYICCPVNGSRR